MSLDHAEVADWDAAYLLGALSAADRRAFEEHLESCERCVRAVAEVAPTLGLLARVDPVRAQSLQGDEAVGDSRFGEAGEWPIASVGGRAELLARAARERRRRRGWWAGGLAAAAAVLVAVAVGASGALVATVPEDRVELAAVVDAPLTASVELASVAWGTRIELECSYDGEGGGASDGLPYTLVVRDHDGNATEVSSWRAVPGETARLSAATALDLDQIASIEINLAENGQLLMRAELDDE